MNELVSFENTSDIIEEIESAFYEIPFENSKFQTESFVIAAQITPERAYRSIGLRMHSKLQALNEAKYSRELEEIQLEEIEDRIANGNLSTFDIRREVIKRDRILSGRNWTNKLINDAISELNLLYKHFKSLPKFTRDQFESAERIHFEQKLNRAAVGIEGAKESLINMNEDTLALSHYQEQVSLLENKSSEQLAILTQNLPNMVKEFQGKR